jgi:hypothetical protein
LKFEANTPNMVHLCTIGMRERTRCLFYSLNLVLVRQTHREWGNGKTHRRVLMYVQTPGRRCGFAPAPEPTAENSDYLIKKTPVYVEKLTPKAKKVLACSLPIACCLHFAEKPTNAFPPGG